MARQERIPFPIFFLRCIFVMLRAVEFYGRLCAVAVKINNIIPDYKLPMDRERQASQKLIPEFSLLFGHFLS